MKIELAVPGEAPVLLDDAPFATLPPPSSAEPARLAYAAVHVILDEEYGARGHSPEHPGDPEEIAAHVDWERTLAFRRHLDDQGMGIAEAMDTAQRFELGWPTAERLIRECGALGLKNGFVAGASSDQRPAIDRSADLIEAVTEQVAVIEDAGGVPVLLPMPWLSRTGAAAEVYVEVYREIIAAARGPILLHWLGPMFLAALEGYFPGESLEEILEVDPAKVRGIKISLLDAELELTLRQRCRARGQFVLTGDDFHFSSLIEGDGAAPGGHLPLGDRSVPDGDFSHALLGVFDGTGVPMGHALRHLAAGDLGSYRAIAGRCEEYGRHVFRAPTEDYKVGLAFTAWLNGHQPNRRLVNGRERRRDRAHLIEVARLASAAGAIADAALAAERLSAFLADEG